MATEALGAGWEVRLWALDDVHPGLAAWTRGHGPGTPGRNINRLAEGLPENLWLVKSDDDVRMRPGDLARWLQLSHRLGLDLTQPGHGQGSFRSHPIVDRNLVTTARLTTFVELGPLVAFSPRVRERVMPQPEEGFGWGVELEWSDLGREGFKLGIVDSTPRWHLKAPGSTYAAELERGRQEAKFAERGISGWTDVQRVRRRIILPWRAATGLPSTVDA
jgi:hypothetical protein